jgi:glycine betaine/proline transport system substrate-binding protein
MAGTGLRRFVRLGGLLALVALVAAACGDVQEDGSPGGGATGPTADRQVPDNRDITITLAVHPWDGSAANAYVAKVLLEEQLGYTVEIAEIDEYAAFPALANGDLDASLEVWPSGHAKDFKRYFGNGAVDGGNLGVIGQIGWWIPTYLLEEHPELATWEGLKGNEDLFRTAESGDAGQILGGDPSYVTFDQAIADNLGLNLKVVYAGSETAQLSALEAAYQKQEPILFYFWTPHWAHAQYDLTMIELPEVTPACEEAAANDPDAYACGYPQDILKKVFHDGLQQKAPSAFAFLSAMSYTNEDQNAIALEIHNGVDPAEAARAWIDAHPDVWQPWVDAGLAAE